MNKDGYHDVVLGVENQRVDLLLNNQDGRFSPFRMFPTTLVPMPGSYPSITTSVAVRDVNQDGKLAIIAVNSEDSTVGVLLNTTTATLLATTAPAQQPKSISVYPNPVHGSTTVLLPIAQKSGETVELTLYDALGRAVCAHAAGAPRWELDMSGLAPGLYLLRAQAGGSSYLRRLLIN